MTAISVSERLLEMAAFYTWLDFTLTYENQENHEGRERHAEPFAAPDPRCFDGDHRYITAKDRAGLTALRDKKGEDHQ